MCVCVCACARACTCVCLSSYGSVPLCINAQSVIISYPAILSSRLLVRVIRLANSPRLKI